MTETSITQAQINAGLRSIGSSLGAAQFTFSLPTAGSIWPGYTATQEPNVSGYSTLNTEQANFFRAAIRAWDELIAPNFTEVADDATSRGEIRIAFTTIAEADELGYAYVGAPRTPGGKTGDIWIDLSKVSGGFAPISEGFAAFVHEIGHTLGLKHPFEGTPLPTGFDTQFFTVMSYTNNIDYFQWSISPGGGRFSQTATPTFMSTPMVLDIAAVQAIYGADPTTRAGNDIYSFVQGSLTIQTIYDAGGTDTIDLSGFTRPSTVDLRPGSYSNIGEYSAQQQINDVAAPFINSASANDRSIGQQFLTFAQNSLQQRSAQGSFAYEFKNNLGIAFGTVIENVIGGSAADIIIGNDAANIIRGGLGADRLTGGLGADVFIGTIAGHNGDNITDFSIGDRIVFTDASQTTLGFGITGNILSYNGGSLTLGTLVAGHRLVASAAPEGGVALTYIADISNGLVFATRSADFNGDSRSDILWRNDNGQFTSWQAQSNASFVANTASTTAVPNDWKIVGTGDFNGDGRGDMLWRNDDGQFGTWLANANGTLSYNAVAGLVAVTNDWKIAATGDFNGDNRDDILWRNANGQFGTWLANANGSFTYNVAAGLIAVANDWRIIATGDFNGDNRDDILWRNTNGQFGTWLANANGSFSYNAAAGLVSVTNDWKIVGVGDFNGDKRADVLWRNDDGQFGNWLGNANGSFSYNAAAGLTMVDSAWQIVGTGDYNGDGRDDLLWRNSNGDFGNWLASANGGFAYNAAARITPMANSWTIQPQSFLVA